MKAFRVGPVLAQFSPVNQAWIVSRDTYVRIARNREEAERYARQMATDHGCTLCDSPVESL